MFNKSLLGFVGNIKTTNLNRTSFRRTFVVVFFISLIAAALWIAMSGSAATPSSGTLSTTTPVLTYDAGPFNTPNQSPVGLGQLDTGPRCNSAAFPCDSYALTVSLPAGYAAAHPNAAVTVTL